VKSHQPSDLGKLRTGYALACKGEARESSGFGSSEYRSFRGPETLVERNRDPRFPERISTVDLGGTHVSILARHRGFTGREN
jgi:hypothetical protein